mmetsp:Transcript_16933/g.40386  ORF Transcript_16933/g.40386 Transcript_16933/m.40386 type:complete len:214 (-) Transcript_16933:845-1486(-)
MPCAWHAGSYSGGHATGGALLCTGMSLLRHAGPVPVGKDSSSLGVGQHMCPLGRAQLPGCIGAAVGWDFGWPCGECLTGLPRQRKGACPWREGPGEPLCPRGPWRSSGRGLTFMDSKQCAVCHGGSGNRQCEGSVECLLRCQCALPQPGCGSYGACPSTDPSDSCTTSCPGSGVPKSEDPYACSGRPDGPVAPRRLWRHLLQCCQGHYRDYGW